MNPTGCRQLRIVHTMRVLQAYTYERRRGNLNVLGKRSFLPPVKRTPQCRERNGLLKRYRNISCRYM
ncbi:hypothetical protein I7I48_05165 [Histoplasma ohiense]|nr:hypothetical protein I7I48_05165 [Histoplasma ohiense (nom. inval.)]